MLQTYSPTPDLSPIDRADLASTTKRQYKRALALMQQAQINPFDFDALSRYASELPTSARAFLKSALRLMLSDLLIRAQAGATVTNLDKVQVLYHRVQAMDKAIITHQPDAQRTPHWLTQTQVNEITTLAYRAGLRDYIVFVLLFNGLLRRDELSNLTFDNLTQVEGHDVIVLFGKGNKKRIVPLPDNIVQHLKEWKKTTGEGRIARAINKHGTIMPSLSPSGIYDLVKKYGALIGIPDLEPHDCRRTGARIMYNTTKDILKVQSILGHSDSKTSIIYIGIQIDTQAVQIIQETQT
jgi:integrase